MFAGQPCHFLEKGCRGCTIYKDRPKDPCKEYTCAWLDDPSLPAWLKPDISNVIITKKTFMEDKSGSYYQIIETGKKIDASVLNWIINWALKNQLNIHYQVDGKFHFMGTDTFHKLMNKKN